MDWKNYLFSFQGRINRAKVWLYILITIGAEIVFFILMGLITGASALAPFSGGASPSVTGFTKITWIIGGLLTIAFFVALLWSSLAVAVKRLHDRNRSGWWLVVFYVAPVILDVTAILTASKGADGQPNYGPVGAVMAIGALGILIWAFVEIYCLRGTTGDNPFGPDPLAVTVSAGPPA